MSLHRAYDTCVHITKKRALNFYYAFLTLPRARRRSICALYAYCRVLDDIADGPGSTSQKAAALEAVQEQFHDSLAGRPPTPLFTALVHTIQQYNIPVTLLDDVARGVTQDLTITRYETFDDLKQYCYLVASAVGLASLRIFGTDDAKAEEAALSMGVALQLTNVLRDVREDFAAGRVYIPQEDLVRFNVTEADLLSPTPSAGLKQLIAYQIQRAETYYEASHALFPHLPRRSRPCPAVMLGVYHRILREIARRIDDGFSQRVTLPKSERAWLALQLGMRGLLWSTPMSSS